MPEESKPNGTSETTPQEVEELGFEQAAAIPEAKFTLLVSSLATQVLVSLGQIENPLSKKKEADLKGAKFSIDLLQMLSDKTRGNLTDVEKRYLEGVLYQLRMGYVDASK